MARPLSLAVERRHELDGLVARLEVQAPVPGVEGADEVKAAALNHGHLMADSSVAT